MRKSLTLLLMLLLTFTLAPTTTFAQTECETSYGGECRIYRYGRCPDSFDPNPVGDFGELGCSATRRCCVPLASGCYRRIPAVPCKSGTTQCSSDPLICCANLSECPAPPPGSGGTGDYFKPSTCGECPPGDEVFCAKYPSIQTALGCIPTHPVAFISQFMLILLGVGGGIAFLLMIVGAAFVLTSRGQPEQVQRGKQVFVGALAGLLMIIFSTFLLELIGVDILGIF